MRSRWIGLRLPLAALAISGCHSSAAPLPSSTAGAAPSASNARLPTKAFHLSRDAAALVDALAVDPFRGDGSEDDPDVYAKIASLLTPAEATALLQHESATVRAYLAVHVATRLARYDSLHQVLRDATPITDETTDLIVQS